MIKNLTIGVLNIVTGSGTLASLKKFWTTCQNSKSSYDETVRNEVPDFDLYESLIQIVSGKNVVADQKIWFQDSLTQNSKDERCEISSKAFLKKFNISFEALRNQSINNLIIGSFKEISCGNWQVVALLLGNTENDMHHELYAELTDWSNNSRLTDIKESFDEDHLHEWTLSPDCCNEFQSIVGKNRTGTSLSSYCALNVNITGAEIHGWLESFARASLALRHRILPGGKKHTTDFIPPADYVIFEKKSPWICSPKQSASASCFLRNSHFFSIIRLRESKLSRKPRFIEDEGDLFVFSADQKEEFYITLKQFNDLIKISKDQDIGLMAKNLGCRKPGRYRAAIVASDKHDLIEKLDKMIAGIVKTERSLPRLKYGNVWNLTGILEPKIAGVFPGQGTQRFQMLRELCMRFPEIRDWFDNLDEAMVDVVGILPSLSIFP